MTEQLRNPSPGFEDAICTHFKLKAPTVVEQCKKWLKEAQSSKTTGFYQKLKKNIQDLEAELKKIDPEMAKLFDDFKVTNEDKEGDDKGKEKDLPDNNNSGRGKGSTRGRGRGSTLNKIK